MIKKKNKNEIKRNNRNRNSDKQKYANKNKQKSNEQSQKYIETQIEINEIFASVFLSPGKRGLRLHFHWCILFSPP